MTNVDSLKFGSVCSGVEAASLAWHVFGWRASWFAEIDKDASQVLRWRFPDVPNLGDMTRLAWLVRHGIIEAPDILVGGCPCQSFSIAGLRKGLADDRGNLTLAYVDLANAIDEVRKDEGKEPCIIIYENVPGLLSHQDNPFGCFLAGLVGEDDPIKPSGKKWTNVGAVYGPQRAAAYRIYNSQHFGVAQRRRRVFLIASAREGFDPAAVLFNFYGVRRDSPPSRETGQGAALDLGSGVEKGSHWDDLRNPHPGLTQAAQGSGAIGYSNQEIFSQRGAGLVPCYHGAPIGARMLAFGKYALDDTASTMKARDYKDATDLVIQPAHCSDIAPTVATGAPFSKTGNSRAECDALVVQPRAISENQRAEVRLNEVTNAVQCAGGKPGQGYQAVLTVHGTQDPCVIEDLAHTLQLNSGQENAVCVTGDITHTLKADGFDGSEDGTGRGQPIVAIPIDLRNANRNPDKRDKQNRQGVGIGAEGDPAHTLTAACVHGVATFKPGQSADAHGIGYEEEIAPTLEGAGGGNNRPALVSYSDMVVRRLMPTETEVLQAFPRNWTLVPQKVVNRKYLTNPREGYQYVEIEGECWQLMPDGSRYKQCGNSFTVTVVRDIGRELRRYLITYKAIAEVVG